MFLLGMVVVQDAIEVDKVLGSGSGFVQLQYTDNTVMQNNNNNDKNLLQLMIRRYKHQRSTKNVIYSWMCAQERVCVECL